MFYLIYRDGLTNLPAGNENANIALGPEQGKELLSGAWKRISARTYLSTCFLGIFVNCVVNPSIYESCGRENVTNAIHIRQGPRSY